MSEPVKARLRYAEKKAAEILKEDNYQVDFLKTGEFPIQARRIDDMIRLIRVELSEPDKLLLEKLKKETVLPDSKKEIWIKIKSKPWQFGHIKFKKINLS